MNQKTVISYISIVVLVLGFGFASIAAVAKNDNAKNDKSNKASESQGKSKTANLKNFEKADSVKGTTNAQVHKEKNEKVMKGLEEVAAQEESAGNTEVSEQIEQVIEGQEEVQEQTSEAIEEVESRGKVKSFLIGTDYKNLGQLRSSLVHNRNDIRKLTKTMSQFQEGEDATLLQQQLEVMMQERERIKTVITTNESGFSLFGWVSRFLSGYQETPINEEEENDLTEEVEEAIEGVTEEWEVVEAVTPTPPVTEESPVQ